MTDRYRPVRRVAVLGAVEPPRPPVELEQRALSLLLRVGAEARPLRGAAAPVRGRVQRGAS